MVLPSAPRPLGSSKPQKPQASLLKKKPPPQQHRQTSLLASFSKGGSSSAGAGGSGSGTSSAGPPRQVSLHELSGVVHYDETEADVPTTLYLGEADINTLKATLEDEASLTADKLRVLRRLSAMPVTRQVLESTRIGVTVGLMRRAGNDDDVRELATRIVAVWKRQLAEEKAQQRRPNAGHRR